jgi:hypothetical protein
MSGAVWVRDELVACGWEVEVADARKVKTVAPLAAKTDKVDARLLAELCRRRAHRALPRRFRAPSSRMHEPRGTGDFLSAIRVSWTVDVV